MKFLLLPDKFKESATGTEVAHAIEKGLNRVFANVECHHLPVSDGGDGFLETVSKVLDCEKIVTKVPGPLGKELSTYYLWHKPTNTAFFELAKASGMDLLEPTQRNPLKTSTYGTGKQMRNAYQKGVEKFVLGLGGSATNDGGIGIAQAMGFSFFSDNGEALVPIGENLSNIHKIVPSEIDWSKIEVIAVNDVENPLFGEHGAAHVYAAQKGADQTQIKLLDEGLRHLAQKVEEFLGLKEANVPGAGAAGGTAYGLKVFFGARFVNGAQFVFDLGKVTDLLEQESFDYIITGEGKLDAQTLNGKLIAGVVRLGKQFNIPVLAVCGVSELDENGVKKLGLQSVISVADPNQNLEYNLAHTKDLIEKKIKMYFSN